MRNCARLLGVTGVVFAISILSGCASVVVTRIDPATHSPCVKGFRYYLPRPYVVVKQEFPIAGDDFYVTGKLDGNGRVISIEASKLPEPVRHYFAADDATVQLPAEDVALPTSTGNAPGTYGTQAAPSDGAAVATATAKTLPDDGWMKDSTVSPNLLTSDRDAFDLAVKISKDAPFVGKFSSAQVGLVPFEDGKCDPSKFIGFPTTVGTEYEGTKTDGQYKAIGSRETLSGGPTFALALKVKGTTKTEKDTMFVVYRTSEDFYASGVKSKAGETQQPKQKNTEITYSEAGLATSGDPTTDPFVKLGNQFFDVLYLPDFDEQYAIRVSGGVGHASAEIGMENGWMVERAKIDIDNRELGKFIFSNVEKLIDLGVMAAKTAIAPGSAQVESAAPLLSTQAIAGVTTAVLRIRYVVMATPGLYPILKSHETQRPDSDVTRDRANGYVFLPYRPYTVLAFNIRRQVLVELVSSATPAGARNAGNDAVVKDFTQWLGRVLPTDHAAIKLQNALKAVEFEDENSYCLILKVAKDALTHDEIQGLEKSIKAQLESVPDIAGKKATSVKIMQVSDTQ